MLSALGPVRSLLVAIFMLMAGAGFIGTLVGFRLEAAGSPAGVIGLVATAYFGGLTVGAFRAGRIVARVGHIRAFAAFVSVLSASTLAYALHQDPGYWAVLRFIDGVCLAGVYICLESWLSERAGVQARGLVLAAYMISLYAGQALGQFLLNLGAERPALPLVAASILVSLAIVPVALTRAISPQIGEPPAFSLRRLYEISPLGLVGSGVTGLILGAFYGLGAVYAQRLGLGLSQTATFMSAVIAGGVALQWPLGWLSDRFDRRRVIIAVFAGATLIALALAFAGTPGIGLLVMGGVFGGLSFALYPLCVAHTNDHVGAEGRVGASAGLVLVYSAGAVTGPLAAAGALSVLGAPGLFAFIAACAALALAFAAWRLVARPPVPADMQQSYQILPRTTPMASTLDPVATEEG